MFIPNDPMMQTFYKMVQESVFSGANEDALTLILRFTQACIDDAQAVKNRREADQLNTKFGFRDTKRNKEFLVLARDLDAFCAENRLDKAKLMEMTNGKVREYKGWQRAQGIGGITGIAYQVPTEIREDWPRLMSQEAAELSAAEKRYMKEMEKTKPVQPPEKVNFVPKGGK